MNPTSTLIYNELLQINLFLIKDLEKIAIHNLCKKQLTMTIYKNKKFRLFLLSSISNLVGHLTPKLAFLRILGGAY